MLDNIQVKQLRAEVANLQKVLSQHKILASERNQANIQDRQIRMEEVHQSNAFCCCSSLHSVHACPSWTRHTQLAPATSEAIKKASC